MIKTRTTSVRSILCLALLATGAVYGQDTRGKVQGVIKDSTQAIVVGAQIVLSNDNTGVQTVEHSSTAGQYLFDFVLPGNYTVTVETPGFRKFVQKNILVQSRGDVTVDAVLEGGSNGDSITIDTTPAAGQANTATRAQPVPNNLPILLTRLIRNPYLLVALNP